MNHRPLMSLLLLLALTVVLTNCAASPSIASIQLTPANASLNAVGDTVQFKAIGTFSRGHHPQETRDITSEVTWASSQPSAATIDNTGLATDAGVGSTTITASMKGDNGDVLGSATLTATGHDLQSVTIVPSGQTLFAIGETAQFVAFGSFNSPPLTQDLTDQVTWRSTDVNLATIDSAGLATAISCPSPNVECATTITATFKSTSGADIGSSNVGTLTVGPLGTGGSNLPSLTVYQVGQGTGSILSVPPGINCPAEGPTGTTSGGCTGNFVLNSTVTLTATPATGSQFGGWSANCTPPSAATCSLTMGNSVSVGAIFNPQ
jgi:hypothetical protein